MRSLWKLSLTVARALVCIPQTHAQVIVIASPW